MLQPKCTTGKMVKMYAITKKADITINSFLLIHFHFFENVKKESIKKQVITLSARVRIDNRKKINIHRRLRLSSIKECRYQKKSRQQIGSRESCDRGNKC